MNWPSLSIIIPSYNQGQYIERTLLSILGQNYPGDLQIIVSDGGSTDETVDVLKKYPQIMWWSERDEGFVDAVSKALKVAIGEIVAIQSSDDFYLEGAFAKALPKLENQQYGFVTGAEVRIYEDGRPPEPAFKNYVSLISPSANLFAYYIPQHCTFVRRSVIDFVGGLRSDVDQVADFDLWYRILHHFHGLMLPEYLGGYQMHPNQRGQSKADLWINSYKKSVNNCEQEDFYASRFRLTATHKEETFLKLQMHCQKVSGGNDGLRESEALAKSILQQQGKWTSSMHAFAKHHTETLSATQTNGLVYHTIVKKIKTNSAIRKVLGKKPYAKQDAEDIDIFWWRKADAV